MSIEQWRQNVDHLAPHGPTEYTSPTSRSRPPAQELPPIPVIDCASQSDAGTTPTNAKRPRPRSTSSEEENERRNRRARARSPPSPSPRARAQSFSSASSSILNSFLWVDRYPYPAPPIHPRPPSRAYSAPPD
jgi:hypothetical protein